MPSLRTAWNPVTPLAAVLALSLLSLAAPPEQRPGWLGLIVVLVAPLAAFTSVRALRTALARAAPAPLTGAPAREERALGVTLRALLAAIAFLVPLVALVTDLGVQRGEMAPSERMLTLALPLAFAVLGAQLWRDLRAARLHRAGDASAQPEARPRPSVTGLPDLDARIGRSVRAAPRIAWVLGFTSAAAWVADQVVHGNPIVAQLTEVKERVSAGEVWRIFTATAVHGSLAGLILNGAAFFAVAPLLELLLGAPRLVFVFVVGGVTATFASYALAPGPFLGAAGAVAAVASALLAFGLRRWHGLPGVTRRRIALHGGVALAAVALAAALFPEVNLAAIGGGGAFGALAGLAFDPPEDARSALTSAGRSPGSG